MCSCLWLTELMFYKHSFLKQLTATIHVRYHILAAASHLQLKQVPQVMCRVGDTLLIPAILATASTAHFSPPCYHMLKWTFSMANLATLLLSPIGLPWVSQEPVGTEGFVSKVPFCFCIIQCFFMLVSCLPYSSTRKMEATCSTETSVGFQQTTQYCVTEDKAVDTFNVNVAVTEPKSNNYCF
jgi:hypothetical protein